MFHYFTYDNLYYSPVTVKARISMRGCAGRRTELLLHFVDRWPMKHHCNGIRVKFKFCVNLKLPISSSALYLK